MTDAETKLWRLFRSRDLGPYKFRRQHLIGRYVVDFACVEARLVVEVDGGQHNGSLADIERTKWLESWGWQVVRFWNNEVLENLNGVAEVLKQTLAQALTRPASPADLSHRGEVNTMQSQTYA
jgi:very-short-patch-repair endonuclease